MENITAKIVPGSNKESVLIIIGHVSIYLDIASASQLFDELDTVLSMINTEEEGL